MNALIPAFVAVLLAEIGGPLTIFSHQRRNVAAGTMVVLVAISVIGGWSIANLLVTPAKTLLLGISLSFAGFGQLGRHREGSGKATLWASAKLLYRSPTPFLAFAFASLMSAPVGAGAGALSGVSMAVAAGTLGLSIPRSARIAAGALLCVAGIFAALSGLRLL